MDTHIIINSSDNITTDETTPKRGRGRPKKTPTEPVEKINKKIGRPKKYETDEDKKKADYKCKLRWRLYNHDKVLSYHKKYYHTVKKHRNTSSDDNKTHDDNKTSLNE